MGNTCYKRMTVLVAVLLIFCTGCAKDTSADPDDFSSGNTTATSVISVEEAKEKVIANLPEEPFPFYVRFEREEMIAQSNYYYFLVYTLSEEPIIGPDGPFYQQYTYAWIYVDSRTGDLYEMPPTGTDLIAWPSKGQS